MQRTGEAFTSSQDLVTNVCWQRTSAWLLEKWWEKMKVQKHSDLFWDVTSPGTFVTMTSLDVIRDVYVPSLPGCEQWTGPRRKHGWQWPPWRQDPVSGASRCYISRQWPQKLMRAASHSPHRMRLTVELGEGGESHMPWRKKEAWTVLIKKWTQRKERNGPRRPGQCIHRTRERWATGLWSLSWISPLPSPASTPNSPHHPTMSLFTLCVTYLLQGTSLPALLYPPPVADKGSTLWGLPSPPTLIMHKGRPKHAPHHGHSQKTLPVLPPLSLTITPHFGSKAKVPQVRRWEALAMARIWTKLWHSSWGSEMVRENQKQQVQGKVVSGQLDAALRSEMMGDDMVLESLPGPLGMAALQGTDTESGLGQGLKWHSGQAQLYTYLLLAFLPTALSVGLRHCPVNLRKKEWPFPPDSLPTPPKSG